MSGEIEDHITKRYEIKKRLGKGVSMKIFEQELCFTQCKNSISPVETGNTREIE